MSTAYVIMLIAANIAIDLERETPILESSHTIKEIIAEHEATLISPDAAGTPAGNGSLYLTILVPNEARASDIADALRRLEAVDTAYVKPAEALP